MTNRYISPHENKHYHCLAGVSLHFVCRRHQPSVGLPSYATDAAAVKFLETGTNAEGKLAMAPMPQFRLNHEDALAVVAYLRSLKH